MATPRDGKYIQLLVNVWYDPNTKRVHITSNDSDLPKEGLHTSLRSGTQADRNTRALLAKYGKLPDDAMTVDADTTGDLAMPNDESSSAALPIEWRELVARNVQDISIRAAQVDDLAHILDVLADPIVAKYLGDAPSPEHLQQKLESLDEIVRNPPSHYQIPLIISVQCEKIGYATIGFGGEQSSWQMRLGDGVSAEHSLYLLPQARRRGFGTAVLPIMVMIAHSAFSVDTHYVKVRGDNDPANALAKSVNFANTGSWDEHSQYLYILRAVLPTGTGEEI